MTNENEQTDFAISCDGLWVTGLIEAGGKRRWVLGLEEERTTYPTREAAQLELDRMAPGEEGYGIEEII